MAEKKNYYEVFGVAEDAPLAEIKVAYRKLAKKYHPDSNKDNPQAAEIFKKVNDIYEILSDEGKRKEYDKSIVRYVSALRAPCTELDGSGIYLDDYDLLVKEDKLEEGGGDIVVDLFVLPAEAVTGAVKEVKVTRKMPCDLCGGTGARQMGPCDICDRTGQVKFYIDTEKGIETTVRVCKTCHGSGVRVIKQCPKCEGKGLMATHQAYKVPVPKNSRIGSTMLKKGDGHKSRDGKRSGDLKFIIKLVKLK